MSKQRILDAVAVIVLVTLLIVIVLSDVAALHSPVLPFIIH